MAGGLDCNDVGGFRETDERPHMMPRGASHLEGCSLIAVEIPGLGTMRAVIKGPKQKTVVGRLFSVQVF